jgi:beta-lactamase regulating signal transducer with metallopeptidase domain
MTPIAALSASTSVLAPLANSAVRILALSGAAGFALAAFRVKSTTVRLFAWTAVLYAGLAMPLLQRALPTVSVRTPAFLQSAEGQPFARTLTAAATGEVRAHAEAVGRASSGSIVRRTASVSRVDRDVRPSGETASVAASKASSPQFLTSHGTFLLSSIPWSVVAAGIYVAVTLLFLVRFCVGLTFGRRLRRASQSIGDPRIAARIASRAHAYGLTLIPQAAESELISVPLTMGVLRAAILLPVGWREWDDAKLDAVIAHEVSHVERRDALTQRLSLLHRAIFWFSPLAWWLDWHLADLAEQASDEAALACGAGREDYARTLLGFFEALQGAPGRVWWQGVAMAKAGQAEKRLERILCWKGSVAMRLKKSIAVVVLALGVPMVYLAASVHAARATAAPGGANIQDQTPQPVPDSAETVPAPPAISGGVKGGIVGGIIGGAPVAPVAGVVGVGPVAPVAAVSPTAWRTQSTGPGPSSSYGGSFSPSYSPSQARGYSYSYGYDDEQRFVIVSGKTDALTMSGSTDDARHVEKLRKSITGDFIWFQRDEKSYVIRDQATIDRARKLWAPQDEIGKKQEELGKQEEALGKQQEELGAKMEQIHVNVPDMTAELDKLKAELKKLSAGATAEQVGDVQSEIGDLQSKIGDIQSKAGDQQSRLGEQMSALGEKQGKLGEEQGKLGEQQGLLAQEASRQMKQLLDEAIAKGTAQPEL